MTTATVLHLDQSEALELYAPFRRELAIIKDSNSTLVFDYTSTVGNKDARSHIFKLRQSKAAVEKARQTENAAGIAYKKKVDSQAKEIIAAFDEMIAVHEAPIRAIEEREKARVALIQRRLAGISKYQECKGHAVEEIEAALEELQAIEIDDSFGEFAGEAALEELQAIEIDDSFGEFAGEAATAKADSIAAQQAEMPNAVQRRDERLELKKLRDEAAERERAAATARRAEIDASNLAAQEARRRADDDHRSKIESAALTALRQLEGQSAEQILTAICAGRIPHITIVY